MQFWHRLYISFHSILDVIENGILKLKSHIYMNVKNLPIDCIEELLRATSRDT